MDAIKETWFFKVIPVGTVDDTQLIRNIIAAALNGFRYADFC